MNPMRGKEHLENLRAKLSVEIAEAPENNPLTPCRECWSSPSIAFKPRTGHYIAVHKTGCSRATVRAATVAEVREKWEGQG